MPTLGENRKGMLLSQSMTSFCLLTMLVEKGKEVDNMNYRQELEKEKREKTQELEEIERKLKEYKTLDIAKQLAIDLHKEFCYSDHVESCGWNYEEKMGNVWDRHAHAHWLGIANEMIGLQHLYEIELERLVVIARILKTW